MPPQGHVLTHTQDAARLKTAAARFLQAGQVTEAAPFLRQYLEYSLLKIIQKLDIPVPLDFVIRDDLKMASNCIDAIEAAIDLNTRAGGVILSTAQQADVMRTLLPGLLTNLINHYTTGTIGGISPHVLLGTLDDIDKLTDCFKYPCSCSGTTTQKFYRSLTARAKACTC